MNFRLYFIHIYQYKTQVKLEIKCAANNNHNGKEFSNKHAVNVSCVCIYSNDVLSKSHLNYSFHQKKERLNDFKFSCQKL